MLSSIIHTYILSHETNMSISVEKKRRKEFSNIKLRTKKRTIQSLAPFLLHLINYLLLYCTY